jgi:O-antigen/teichoic acid export membrane protein
MLLRSVSLMMVLNLLKAAVTLLLSFLITRFVPPDEYGLIAFALPFVALLSLLTDLGIASAILREISLTPKQAGSIISLMMALGLLACITLAASAEGIESYSGINGAKKILIGFSLVTGLQVWATAPRALLERIHSYGIVTVVEAISLVLALLSFFGMLHVQPGIFALVLFHIVLQFCRALIFLISARKCFVFVLIPRNISSLVNAGGWIFVSNLLSYASRNFDKLIVGKQMGQVALGMYGFAYQFMTIPLVLLSWPASNVLVSTLTIVGNNTTLRRDVVRAFICITSIIGVPLVTYISLGLEYPLHKFLSHKWEGVSLLISLLTPVGLFQSIAVYASAVLISIGKFKLNFILGLINGTFIPGAMFVSSSYGLIVFVKCYALASIFVSTLMIIFMCRAAALNFKLFFKAILPGVFSGILGILFGYLVNRDLPQDLLAWLLSSTAFVLGVLLGFFICRNEIRVSLNIMKKSRSDIIIES